MLSGNLKSNIPKLYFIKALRWFLLVIPILVLFFQENGLSMKQVLLLQSCFSVAIVVFEVPSGYFADVIGRKFSIIIGSVLGFIAFVIYSFSYGFWGFLGGELIMGLGASFISGADSAMLYDSLLATSREEDYKKIEGRMSSVGNFSEGIASIVGGFLALISLRTPFYWEVATCFFAIPIAFTLVEPPVHKRDNSEGSFRSILRIVRYSLHEHAEVKWLIFYSAVIGASTLTMVWFIQPYLKLVGLPLPLFGIVWAALQFSVGIFALRSHWFEARVGRKKSLVSLIVLSAMAYFLLSYFSTIWAIGFIFIFYFVRGVGGPVFKDYINKLIESDIRATVLSVKNLVGRLLFAVIGPIIGWVSDFYSLQTALGVSGGIFLFLGAISLLFLKKNKAL
ncbi:MAG: MFS transporter [bacterium]|nr:MFS transporter [bacterium]